MTSKVTTSPVDARPGETVTVAVPGMPFPSAVQAKSSPVPSADPKNWLGAMALGVPVKGPVRLALGAERLTPLEKYATTSSVVGLAPVVTVVVAMQLPPSAVIAHELVPLASFVAER